MPKYVVKRMHQQCFREGLWYELKLSLCVEEDVEGNQSLATL